MTFAPETVYFDNGMGKWYKVSEHESLINTMMFRGGAKPEDNARLTNMCFSRDPCFPELWTRSEIHPFYPWRQGHAVMERMVWNLSH